MEIKNGKLHEWAYVAAINSSNDYSHCVIEFSDAWASEMEKHLADGFSIDQCADITMHEVDGRPGFGITGFMYGCAVGILAEVWVHGEDLRRWHNLKTQLGNEGERANERGTVLNPAILCIGGE